MNLRLLAPEIQEELLFDAQLSANLTSVTKVMLWIDGEGLIRKIYNETVVDPAKMPASARKANLKTAAFTAHTTMIFNPIANEANIDDSKFTQEDK